MWHGGLRALETSVDDVRLRIVSRETASLAETMLNRRPQPMKWVQCPHGDFYFGWAGGVEGTRVL
jgi:hypothetical protein